MSFSTEQPAVPSAMLDSHYDLIARLTLTAGLFALAIAGAVLAS